MVCTKRNKIGYSCENNCWQYQTFFAWALTWGLLAKPEKTRVKVSKTVDILAIPKPIDAENKDQKLEVYHGIFGPNAENPIGWYANVVLNGDADKGTFGNSSLSLIDMEETVSSAGKSAFKKPC